ncbi:SusC/RagA family TonB-linked outer membrane protein [Sphingobacterium sp. InxBP1]|uniref:SusC/RagA family TonB-linked outer membrane protein n=1 Tax=Sphingobacterium sp. InxBP1 TaxID=2870328 RepID=UPI00224485C6|nr:SusC/RagA family TonB-linked outer membrane protein [Sphingobacterium sp. InxBP1]MCW8313831.1 SusC/RagA family TonB-linked outer membrane protein [Sphingobacterium sp. InxBP1]
MKKLFINNNSFRCCLLFFCSLIFVTTVFGQHAKITIQKKGITIDELLTELRIQSGVDFVSLTSKVDHFQRIDVNFKDEPLYQVLDKYFNVRSGVVYVFRNNSIILMDEQKAKMRRISGVVHREDTDREMAGVSLTFTDKAIKANTDINGKFIIQIPEYAKALEVSYLGFKKKTVPLTAATNYIIHLSPTSEELNEVVVTGIFNRSAESFTGATTTVSGEEIKKINTNSVLAAISAVDPAFRLVANNQFGGDINRLPEVQMRGQNSFPNLSGELSNNPNEPLFILDGFQVNLQRVVDLDMNLIKSITLLKDASATAIYGSRGANGVMVITTIPPAAGKVQVTLTNDFRIATPELGVYNLLNAREKLDFEKRAGFYTGTFNIAQLGKDVLYNSRLKNILEGVDTDWLKIPTQIGRSNRSSLRVQGGDEIFRYGLQFTADMQEGVMKGQDRNNYSGQVDLSYNVDKFRFMNSLRVFQNKANVSPYGSFSDYVTANPYFSPYDAEGNIPLLLEEVYYHEWYEPFTTINPLYNTTLHSVNKSAYFGVTNNFSVRYNITPGLFVESNFSITKQHDDSDQFYSAQDSRFAAIAEPSRRGSYTARTGKSFGYESLTTANYNVQLGKHQLFSMLGFNAKSAANEFYQIVAEGFPYDRLDNLLFANQYQTNGRPTGDESTTRNIGLVYSGNYSYDNRYLMDLSVRRDGSSQFGTDRRFGTFWSAGLGWNIHNEHFFKDSPIINKLRLRANYGSTGSLNIPAYGAQFRYSLGVGSSYYDQLGAVLNNLGNYNLSWQNVYKLNIGMDASLMNQRLDLRMEIYRDDTKNALTSVTLAPSTGFSSYSENLGELRNTGMEFSARYAIINRKEKGVLWSVNVNGFTNKNILKKLSNKLKTANEDLNTANEGQIYPNVLLEEGQSMNTIFAVRSLGIDPATGTEMFLKKDGTTTYDWDIRDKVPVGIQQPKWNGNFGSNLIYKGFELNLIFNYQFGGKLYNYTLVDRVENVDISQNVDRRAYELGWSKPGDVSLYKRIVSTPNATKATSRFVQDDNNLKLTSASLGYNFYGKAFLKRLGFNSLSITALANDPIWWSSVQLERGTDNPFARNYSLSLRASF